MKTDVKLVQQWMGKKIKARRKYLGMTQLEFSEILSLTRTSVSNIETGRQNIGIDRLVEIADALRCDLADLLPKIR